MGLLTLGVFLYLTASLLLSGVLATLALELQRKGDDNRGTLVKVCLVGIICHRSIGGAGVFFSRISSFSLASLLVAPFIIAVQRSDSASVVVTRYRLLGTILY